MIAGLRGAAGKHMRRSTHSRTFKRSTNSLISAHCMNVWRPIPAPRKSTPNGPNAWLRGVTTTRVPTPCTNLSTQNFKNVLRRLLAPPGASSIRPAGMSDEEIEELMTSLSPEEMDDFFTQEQQTVQQDIDQEALAALQAEERALAVVSAECSGGLYEQFIELIREYEAALVDENRALLEQFRDSREG